MTVVALPADQKTLPGPDALSPLAAHSPIAQAVARFLFVTSLSARPATVVYYERHLRPLLDLEKPVGTITIGDLQWLYAQLHSRQMRYATHPTRPALASGLSTYTLHKYIRAWKRLFNWLVDEEVLQRSPAAKLERPRLPRRAPKHMTRDDLERMLESARGNQRDYALICFLADTACRVGGVATLRMHSLHLREQCAIVREKGDEDREVIFEERTRIALERYITDERARIQERLLERGIEYDAKIVFLGEKGALTTGGIFQALERTAQRAGVQGRYNPHSLRHGWAIHALKNKANLKQVQQYLGHKSITTTATFYAIYLDDDLRAQHAQFTFLPLEQESEAGRSSDRPA